MKFGKVSNPEEIDFTLPKDHPDTKRVLHLHTGKETTFEVYVGCAKWNKTDLKGFYPKGTKDELSYYATQFNSIELNATFYNMPKKEQIIKWKEKTTEGFRFSPKITNSITHYKRLVNVKDPLETYCDAVSHFEEKLGMVFMQLHDNFSPKEFDKLKEVLQNFPAGIPLAVEVRNSEWFSDKKIFTEYAKLLEKLKMANIIVDTAGRRDMLHMRLTGLEAFVRYVGANHASDITRLDDWIKRIKKWRKQGLQKLYFFIHQNVEVESPLLASYFINELNKALELDLKIPETLADTQKKLFE